MRKLLELLTLTTFLFGCSQVQPFERYPEMFITVGGNSSQHLEIIRRREIHKESGNKKDIDGDGVNDLYMITDNNSYYFVSSKGYKAKFPEDLYQNRPDVLVWERVPKEIVDNTKEGERDLDEFMRK